MGPGANDDNFQAALNGQQAHRQRLVLVVTGTLSVTPLPPREMPLPSALHTATLMYVTYHSGDAAQKHTTLLSVMHLKNCSETTVLSHSSLYLPLLL